MKLEDAYWKSIRDRIDLFYDWVHSPHPDFGSRPFQVVGTLTEVRNAIIHGKRHLVEVEVTVVDGELARMPRALLSDWEPDCTVDRAIRHRNDLLAVHQTMVAAAGGMLGDPLAFLAMLGLGRQPSLTNASS